jgi:DnaK suppressor protein
MNQADKSKLLHKITVEIAETEHNIESLQELTKPVAPDNALGRLTRLDAIGSKSIKDASLGMARDKLNKLRYAKANLDKPHFGICSECYESIPIARILIMPESNLCVACAEDLEN